MIKTLMLSLTLVVLPGQAASPPPPPIPMAAAPDPSGIQFTVTPRANDGQAQFSLSYGDEGRGRSQQSGPQSWDDLRGLNRADLDRDPPAVVAFEIVRPAGVIACSGVAGGGAATGGCRFEADDGFAEALAARVQRRPEARQLFQLALSDFRLETLDELERQGYPRPDLDEVVAVGIHRVDAAYVRGLAEAGYRLGSIDDLVGFRIHRVTPEYIAAMAAIGPGFARLPAGELMALRIHRVTPEFAREMAALGYGGQRPDDLVSMRIHRVTPEFVRALSAAGYDGLPASTLLAFGVHGVTPGYIEEMAAAGYRNLTPEQLVALRIHGVDSRYARSMQAEGVTESRRERRRPG